MKKPVKVLTVKPEEPRVLPSPPSLVALGVANRINLALDGLSPREKVSVMRSVWILHRLDEVLQCLKK